MVTDTSRVVGDTEYRVYLRDTVEFHSRVGAPYSYVGIFHWNGVRWEPEVRGRSSS